MYEGKKVIVVMPAYKAALTLEKTYQEIPHDWVDEVILVDDYSPDNTVEVAKKIGIKHIVQHDKNLGYGGNQKSCYTKALALGGDIVIMLHPDYQYTPMLLKAMIYNVELMSLILIFNMSIVSIILSQLIKLCKKSLKW